MDINILVIIALKEEFDVFLEKFPISFIASTKYQGIQEGKYKISSVETSLNIYAYCVFDMTSIESFDSTSKWMDILKPNMVISIGIAGGLWDEKNMSLGDVIIVQSATEVMHKGIFNNGNITPGGITENTDHSLESDFKILANKDSFQKKLNCRVMFGPIATTPFVIADDKAISSILSSNRNFHAVDMEAYGVGRATNKSKSTKFWAVKGISDYADKNKSVLEAITKGKLRKKAMENAVSAFIMLMQQETGVHLFKNKVTLEYGIEDQEKRFISQGSGEVFDALKRGGDDKRYCEEYLDKLIEGHTLQELIDYVISNREDKSLSIIGKAGGGVTSVLTGVGVKLIEIGLSVFYINLKKYTLLEAYELIDSDVIKILSTSKPDVFIMDGWDGYHENRKKVAETIQDKIVDLGHSSMTFIYGFRNDGSRKLYPPAIDIEVQISKLDAEWIKANPKIIDAICGPKNSEKYWRQINSLKYLILDPFILHALASRSFEDEYNVIKDYCMRRVNYFMKGVSGKKLEKIINKASYIAYSHFKQTAFNIEDQDEDSDHGEDDQKKIECECGLSDNYALACDLAFCHESVSNYLVANHVINMFLLWHKSGVKQKKQVVPEVFPQTINWFCKAIIQSDVQIQRDIVSAISNVLNSDVHPYMKAHGCYLLGRVNDQQLIGQAIKLLEEITQNNIYVNGKEKPILMVGRSAYISMTYLKKESVAIEYVDKLFENDSWDMLNRGFHLEYYGDRSYDPGRPLESMDDLYDWENTYTQLIRSSIRAKDDVVNIVDIYTLFSLAYNRHKQGILHQLKKTELISLGKKIMPNIGRYENLKRYVNHCVCSMESGSDLEVRIFTERYSLQYKKRTGYTTRGLLMGQSIADHIHGAVAIAEHYLKDVYDGIDSYSKVEVIALVRLHDDGEGRSGDYNPDDSDKYEKIKIENEYFQDLRLMQGKYSSYAKYPILWEEYKAAETNNARIARDIDKIENYLCLRVYQSLGFEPKDITEWIKGLESSLSRIGDVIYQEIKSKESEIIEYLKMLLQHNGELYLEQWDLHVKEISK